MELVTIIFLGGRRGVVLWGAAPQGWQDLSFPPGIEQAKAVKKPSPNLWTTQGTPIIFIFTVRN